MAKTKILVKLVVFFVFLLTLYITSSYAVDNALVNSGFEEGEGNWYNWSEDASTSSGEISTKYSHSGNNSACREISGKGLGGFGQVIAIIPGDTIKASAWIMNPLSEPLSKGAEAYLRIEFWKIKEGAGEPLGSGQIESIHITEPTKWIKVEVRGTAPSDVTEARILGFTNGKNSSSKGKVYFDDFETTIISKLH